jgi:hypothetical protein
MPLKMETIVSPKRRDNPPTPGGDILDQDIVDSQFKFYISTSVLISGRKIKEKDKNN